MRFRTTLIPLALFAAGCATADVDATSVTEVPATTTTTTTPTTTTITEPAFTAAAAMTVVDEYFDAYNAGDFARLEALFTSDASFSDNFGSQDREFWAQLETWNLSQGTQLEDIDCSPQEPIERQVSVECTLSNLDSVVQAVSAPPVPIDLEMTITPDGISERESIFGQPDFLNALGPFYEWMATSHPDDADKVGFGQWNSLESAAQNGVLMAQYAQAWAAYLESNNCSFDQEC